MAKKILVRPLGYHPLLVMKIELIKRLTNGILTSLETTNLFSYNARCDHHEFFDQEEFSLKITLKLAIHL